MIIWNACKICKSERLFTIRTYCVNLKSSEEWERVFREVIPNQKELMLRLTMCRNCGFFFYRDGFDDEEISRLYKTERRIDHVTQSSTKEGRKWEVKSMQSFLQRFPEVFSVKSTIDIGAGDFFTLDALTPFFLNCQFEALDPCYSASEYRGILVHNSMLENFSVSRKYGLVLAIHILEHVGDLHRFMEKIALLSEKYLYVEVPYQVGLGLLRDSSANAQHINYFTPESLSDLMGRYGFQVLHMELDIDGYRHIGMPGMIRVVAKIGARKQKNEGGIILAIFRFFDPRPIFKSFM